MTVVRLCQYWLKQPILKPTAIVRTFALYLDERLDVSSRASFNAELSTRNPITSAGLKARMVVGTTSFRASVLDGEDSADANVKDITVENFSVSTRGKELLKNASVKISHGKRYCLIGPNGKGKSTLLKLLVPKNIDMLLVEQKVVGDERTALEAVVSANEELVKLRQEAAALQNRASAKEEDDDENAGEKLADLYERLQLMSFDSVEAQASKILAGSDLSVLHRQQEL
ncbi:hypothetical protein NE237_027626 [Protea cynaroides]|uniref:ABC transporter domain-containing protein n=1 Tax=Protea cynaroides TaxID=273540 RepID=A0A9Q0JS38_9MAGN|nr:hypothetical protein NE237_027626 [Protea cynaroides]